jgi:hypothetical protein
MLRPWTGRLALAALLTCTLAACCGQRWDLTEPGLKAVTTARSGPTNLVVDYDTCDMSAGTVALMDRARLILGDEEKALIDYQARVERALTDGERGALVAKRDTLLDGMVSQVDQLRKVILHIAPKGATSQIAVVYTATSVTAVTDVPVITARFAYVTSLGPTETPAGIVVKEVTPRHALSGLVDAMERFAVEQSVLDSETKERLSAE